MPRRNISTIVNSAHHLYEQGKYSEAFDEYQTAIIELNNISNEIKLMDIEEKKILCRFYQTQCQIMLYTLPVDDVLYKLHGLYKQLTLYPVERNLTDIKKQIDYFQDVKVRAQAEHGYASFAFQYLNNNDPVFNHMMELDGTLQNKIDVLKKAINSLTQAQNIYFCLHLLEENKSAAEMLVLLNEEIADLYIDYANEMNDVDNEKQEALLNANEYYQTSINILTNVLKVPVSIFLYFSTLNVQSMLFNLSEDKQYLIFIKDYINNIKLQELIQTVEDHDIKKEAQTELDSYTTLLQEKLPLVKKRNIREIAIENDHSLAKKQKTDGENISIADYSIPIVGL